jgi:transcription elongation GreA/GreB family factor
MFDKQLILAKVREELQREFENISKSAHHARDAATHEDSKAENKYDTRGLEASYLAGAQAKRAQHIQDLLGMFKNIRVKNYTSETPIESTALVETLVNGEDTKWFFMVPQQGGMKININNTEIVTLSPESPLGQLLYQKTVDEVFEFSTKGVVKEYEITDVY